MVLEIAAHSREMRHHRNVVFAEMRGIADPRKEQELWRVDGAAAYHDFPRRVDLVGRPAPGVLDPDRAPAVEEDAVSERAGLDDDVVALHGGPEVGARGAPSLASVDGPVRDPEALLLVAVVVLAVRITGLQRGFQEGPVERPLRRGGGDVQGTARSAIVVGAPIVVLVLLEVRQAVRVGPLGQVVAGPAVEVEGMATDEHHAVDGRGAAQRLAAGAVHPAPVHVGLRIRVVVPVVTVVVQRVVQGGGNARHERALGAARFEHQHAGPRRFTQARGDHAAGGAGADDDVVEASHHGVCFRVLPARSAFAWAPPRRRRPCPRGSPRSWWRRGSAAILCLARHRKQSSRERMPGARSAGPQVSPIFVARASRCRDSGAHGLKDAEGVADTTSKRRDGVRPANTSILASAVGNR